MAVKNIKDKKEWEDFFLKIERRTFLNSWDWGEFRKSLGDEVWRKGIIGKDGLNCLFLISKIKSKKGNFILLTHCPAMKSFSRNDFEEAIKEVKKIATTERVDFIRIAPIFEKGNNQESFLKEVGFKESPSSVFPVRSWETDLLKNEKKILSEMRKGTRYLIKKGQNNKEIDISVSSKEKDLKIFYELQKKTAKRQGFNPFSFDYLKKEFEIFSKNNQLKLFLGTYKNKYVAGAMIIFWGVKAFYHHGASIITSSEAPVSHLIQWEAMKEAKKRGCQTYNFWAISPSDDIKHKWAGLTFFKKGFGGKEINYSNTKDFPLSRKYLLTYWIERLRK